MTQPPILDYRAPGEPQPKVNGVAVHSFIAAVVLSFGPILANMIADFSAAENAVTLILIGSVILLMGRDVVRQCRLLEHRGASLGYLTIAVETLELLIAGVLLVVHFIGSH